MFDNRTFAKHTFLDKRTNDEIQNYNSSRQFRLVEPS